LADAVIFLTMAGCISYL